MRIKTLSSLIIVCALLVSLNASSQTWYWTRQADSSNSQTASQVAVDRNDNPVYTGYCNGTKMSFGSGVRINITGAQTDFLAKYSSSGTILWARNDKALNVSAGVWGVSVSTDRNNNIIETGYFTDSIAFGTYHLHSVGSNYNTFIVKYDPSGNVIWAVSPKASVTTNCQNLPYCVSADKQNNVVVAGYFVDTAYFGGTTLTAAGTDMYLVQYSPSGAVIWARTATLGAGAYAYALSVATDDSCNAYIAGNISGTVTFGATAPLTAAGNIYLAKYDSAGNAKWALNTMATPNQLLPTPVTVDKSNNVYLGAQFTNLTLVMGPSTVTDGSFIGASNSLLAKYTRNNGTCLWATCADYISQDEINTIIESSVATDRCNNVYWSGLVSDSFGVGNVKVTVPGGGSNPTRPFAYVIKLDSNGNAIAGAAINNQNFNSFSNYLAVDSLSKALFVTELVAPAGIIVGSDTVRRYLTNSTAFISKFAVIPPVLHGTSRNDSICPGDSALLSVNPINGTTYTWSTGATIDSIYVKPPTTTTYFVAMNNGCEIDTSFIKVIVSPLNISIHGQDSICHGDSVWLTASGGTSYVWSTSATTDSIKVGPSGTVTYTVTGQNGVCNNTATFTVNVVPIPVAAIAPTPADSVCKGDSVELKGSGGVTYKWSNGKTTSNIWVSPTIATTYTLYVNQSACPDSTTAKIKIIPAITATVTVVHDTVCPNGSSTLTAIASGGPVTSYKWSNGKTTSFINVIDTGTTQYIATVYGICDSVKDTVTVHVVKLPVPVITGSSWRCLGGKDTLIVSGGTNYKWSNGSTSTSYITGAIKGDSTITVTAYNSLGCSKDTTFTVLLRTTSVIVTTAPFACAGSQVVIGVFEAGNGVTYKWAPGGETTDSITVNNSTATTYTVTVNNGCPVKEIIPVTADSPVLTACCDKIILIGDDTTIVAHGDSILSFNWSPSVDCLNPICDSVNVKPTVTTTYTVVGKDRNGCETETIITIIVETPCFNFIVPNVFTPTNPGTLGLDNVFYIKTENLNAWSIVIFDRWGKEMYKSNNPNQYWDGKTEGGGEAPSGVYYYIINATCQGNSYKKQGFVQLIR